MSSNRWRLVIGGILILFGLLALVENLPGVQLGELIVAAVFVLAGLVFLYVLITDRRQWWAAIPGFTLLGIGLLIGLERLAPQMSDSFGGAIVVGAIAVSFLVVYLMNRQFWWAIIPAGTMLSITALIILEPFTREPVWAFFLGLAATFGVLSLVPVSEVKRMTWPLIPAVVLAVMGVIFMMGEMEWANYVMPVLLIAFGIFFVFRAMRPKASSEGK